MVKIVVNEYINRNELMDARQKAIWVYENANILNAGAIRDNLKPLLDQIVDLPAAPVDDHVKGKWLTVYSDGKLKGGKCSKCGKYKRASSMNALRRGYKFCHGCGAKMIG